MADSLVTYPRLVPVGDPSGFTLTRANFTSMTPDVIVGMGFTQYESDILRRAVEARIVGVVPNTLVELVNSRLGTIDKSVLASTKIEGLTASIEPYKYRRRKRNFRMSWFNIVGAQANPNAGTGSVPASAWDLTINCGPGKYATPFTQLSRWFTTNASISVDWMNNTTKVCYRVAMPIYAAVDVGDPATSTTLTLTVSAPFTDAYWNGLASSAKAPFQPTYGVVTPLGNNTNDFESMAVNAPQTNANELITDWIQTSRTPRIRNKLYEQGLADIEKNNVNSYIRDFQVTEIAERNRQEMAYWEAVDLNTFFYGGRINENQVDNPTHQNILGLPTVLEHEDGNIIGRKANAVGLMTQLEENGRVIDFGGGPLNFDTLKDLLYEVRRNRQIDGKPHDIIDMMMSRQDKMRLDVLLTAYLRELFGYDLNTWRTQGKVLDSNNVIMFEYTVYDLPQEQLKVALITHRFFEDRQSAFGNGTKASQGNTIDISSVGRNIWVLDWEDIKKGIAGTNSVMREYRNDITAQANTFYSKTMRLNTFEYDLRSVDWDVELGDFQRHLVLRNYSNNAPILHYIAPTGLTTS